MEAEIASTHSSSTHVYAFSGKQMYRHAAPTLRHHFAHRLSLRHAYIAQLERFARIARQGIIALDWLGALFDKCRRKPSSSQSGDAAIGRWRGARLHACTGDRLIIERSNRKTLHLPHGRYPRNTSSVRHCVRADKNRDRRYCPCVVQAAGAYAKSSACQCANFGISSAGQQAAKCLRAARSNKHRKLYFKPSECLSGARRAIGWRHHLRQFACSHQRRSSR